MTALPTSRRLHLRVRPFSTRRRWARKRRIQREGPFVHLWRSEKIFYMVKPAFGSAQEPRTRPGAVSDGLRERVDSVRVWSHVEEGEREAGRIGAWCEESVQVVVEALESEATAQARPLSGKRTGSRPPSFPSSLPLSLSITSHTSRTDRTLQRAVGTGLKRFSVHGEDGFHPFQTSFV